MDFKTIEVDGEKIYLKKSGEHFRIVHPIYNDDGSYNWKNLITGGSWFNLLFILFCVVVAIGFFFEYHSNLEICSKLMAQHNLENSLNYKADGPVYIESLKLIPNASKFFNNSNG